MKPKTDGNTRDMRTPDVCQTRVRVKINHPLLNKWLKAEIINNLPDETAQAIADLIEAAVRRKKVAENVHTRCENYGGGGKTNSAALEQIREFLSKGKVVKDVSEKQSEQQGN